MSFFRLILPPAAGKRLFPGGAKAAPVWAVQVLHPGERQLGLVLHNAELADAGILLDGHVPGGVDGHVPLVAVPAVGLVHHAHAVGLQNAVFLNVELRGAMWAS